MRFWFRATDLFHDANVSSPYFLSWTPKFDHFYDFLELIWLQKLLDTDSYVKLIEVVMNHRKDWGFYDKLTCTVCFSKFVSIYSACVPGAINLYTKLRQPAKHWQSWSEYRLSTWPFHRVVKTDFEKKSENRCRLFQIFIDILTSCLEPL